eukprot:1787379-Pyramimonas_sp.AAC.1
MCIRDRLLERGVALRPPVLGLHENGPGLSLGVAPALPGEARPAEPLGHGAVDQAVELVALNALGA